MPIPQTAKKKRYREQAMALKHTIRCIRRYRTQENRCLSLEHTQKNKNDNNYFFESPNTIISNIVNKIHITKEKH